MPDDRMIHRRMLRGERIGLLTDFERGVWLAFELLADDYGVMRFSAAELQKAIWLETKPAKLVVRGMERVLEVGLLHTFTDGERRYCYQRDWQSWQHIRHVRGTIEPCPPVDQLQECDIPTQALFCEHPRKPSAFFPELSGKSSEEIRKHFGFTRGRTLANGKRLPANGSEGGEGETSPPKVAHDGPRLRVWQWMHDDLARRLGGKVDAFDLLGWYGRLEDELARTGEGFADPWRWLQGRLYRDADLPAPNLFGRERKPAGAGPTGAIAPEKRGQYDALTRRAGGPQ